MKRVIIASCVVLGFITNTALAADAMLEGNRIDQIACATDVSMAPANYEKADVTAAPLNGPTLMLGTALIGLCGAARRTQHKAYCVAARKKMNDRNVESKRTTQRS